MHFSQLIETFKANTTSTSIIWKGVLVGKEQGVKCYSTLGMGRMRRNILKGQADVSSACLPLSYEVLLIDKNEFVVRGECRP